MTAARPGRLPRWQEWAVYVALGLLLASGIAWLVFDQWVRVAGEFGSEHHPAQHWVLIVHGVVAYGFLIIAGALIPVHIRLGWGIGRNRNSGSMLAAVCLLLSLSALGLYYVGEDAARHWTSIVHWSVGLILLPLLLLHAIRGRQARHQVIRS